MAYEAPIKSYSKAELRKLYGISSETLRAWLKRVKGLSEVSQSAQILTPAEVEIIFKHLGAPTIEK